ncbi:hypothetical protein BDB01DRAFT_604156 [Pilobolus umbonatus]|nr:hypothetical protein BDB01DRAFT_604156 [Pilobolus umbonatus]
MRLDISNISFEMRFSPQQSENFFPFIQQQKKTQLLSFYSSITSYCQLVSIECKNKLMSPPSESHEKPRSIMVNNDYSASTSGSDSHMTENTEHVMELFYNQVTDAHHPHTYDQQSPNTVSNAQFVGNSQDIAVKTEGERSHSSVNTMEFITPLQSTTPHMTTVRDHNNSSSSNSGDNKNNIDTNTKKGKQKSKENGHSLLQVSLYQSISPCYSNLSKEFCQFRGFPRPNISTWTKWTFRPYQ